MLITHNTLPQYPPEAASGYASLPPIPLLPLNKMPGEPSFPSQFHASQTQFAPMVLRNNHPTPTPENIRYETVIDRAQTDIERYRGSSRNPIGNTSSLANGQKLVPKKTEKSDVKRSNPMSIAYLTEPSAPAATPVLPQFNVDRHSHFGAPPPSPPHNSTGHPYRREIHSPYSTPSPKSEIDTPVASPTTSSVRQFSPVSDHEPAVRSAPKSGTVLPSKVTKASRRKRWCPVCQGLYSNLAAHRATHIAEDDRPHICEDCGRAFARQNDLVRHQKSHEGSAAYICPFFAANVNCECHINGRFSRGDTFKNHLKSMHFVYPPGTRRTDRREIPGQCRECLQHFPNVGAWMKEHMDTGTCPSLANSTQSR